VQGELSLDASDALGISICHAHYQQTAAMLGKQGVFR
jgi:crossover junction endodeoxyribonuclease RuvC